MDTESHDLADFMQSVTEEVTREYERIQKRVNEDPGTAGEIRVCGDVRNKILHDVVWAKNEVDSKLCVHTQGLEHKAMNARKRQKYWHEKEEREG